MVRGKCIFLSVYDIIETIISIKKYAEENKDTFRVIEVESRFTSDPPISDITFKIVIR